MSGKNIVFIGKSIDGYIAGINGELDWLDIIPNPDNNDMGYVEHMKEIDAILMGRNTFEVVCGFEGEWPYEKPVFVLSNSIKSLPEKYNKHAQIINGNLEDILDELHSKGYQNLYIDGGKTIQSFLAKNLIDKMVITTLPIVLGDGIPLFTKAKYSTRFDLIKTEVYLNQLVQCHYVKTI